MPKVVIESPHYFANIGYVDASPEYPQIVDLHEKWIPSDPAVLKKQNFRLLEDDEDVKGTALGKSYADGPKTHVQSSAQVQSEPTKDAKGKRAADKSPI